MLSNSVPSHSVSSTFSTDFAWATPVVRGPEHLVRVGPALWRVVAVAGGIRGHIRAVEHPLGVRYRAERLQRGSGQFWLVGEFWSADDAVSALRYC